MADPIAGARDPGRAAGLRATVPRLRVMRLFLERAGEPMAAERVLRTLLLAGDTMSLSTVYTIVKRFAAAGLVAGRFDEGRRVFVREPVRAPVRCRVCERRLSADDARIDAFFAQLAKDWLMPLSRFSVTLYGRCPACGACAVTCERSLDKHVPPARG